MRFYKLAGSEQYVSWDTLHNVAGYSEQATNEITWKSVENWGASAGTGYELPVELFGDSELFMNDVVGWHDLDCFALEVGVYPSTASDMVLTHPTYGSSPVVFMVFDDGTYYLIQKDISQGWMTEEEYTERGWKLPNFIIIDANGQIKSSIQYTPNSFTGTGHDVLQDASEVVETGTEHDVLQDANEVVFVENEPEPQPEYLDIFFYFNGGGTSVTFNANDYWSTRIRNDSDKAALAAFGVPVSSAYVNGYYRNYVSREAASEFSFTPLALYSGDGNGDLQADMSNFYCAICQQADSTSIYYGVCIWSINAYSTNMQTWKCRITRINGGN